MDPQLYGQVVFGKVGKTMQQSLQQMVLWKLDSNIEKNKTGFSLITYTKINLKNIYF